MERISLSCAETAKLLREVLKETFPGVKFGVRSKTYSGGASIRIEWLDGPTQKAVERAVSKFEGSYFDGMIDYKGSIYHEIDGKEARMGADFIFCNRDHSDPMVEWAIEMVWDEFRPECPKPSAWDWRHGLTNNQYVTATDRGEMHWSVQSAVHRALAEIDWYGEAKDSKTFRRVRKTGDDGYGATYGSMPA